MWNALYSSQGAGIEIIPFYDIENIVELNKLLCGNYINIEWPEKWNCILFLMYCYIIEKVAGYGASK